MPEITTIVYEPVVTKLRTEKEVIDLLQEIKRVISDTRPFTLKETLLLVERETPVMTSVSRELNFSKVKKLLEEYRLRSEMGCASCIYDEVERVTFPNQWGEFCSNQEGHLTPQEYKKRMSPRVRQYFKTGCEDYSSRGPSTIGTILSRLKRTI